MNEKQEWTAEELEKSLQLCEEKCNADPAFHERFKANPKAAFKELIGKDLPPLEQSVDANKLNDEQLESVSGGFPLPLFAAGSLFKVMKKFPGVKEAFESIGINLK